MFRNLINSGKCLLGFHQGNWEYEEPKKCLKFQVCTHCGKRSTKVEHAWGEWKYRADEDCRQICTCKRCEEKEEQIVHVWSDDAYYKKDNECSTVNYCDRCRAEKPAGVIHVWGDWKYLNDDSCDQKQKCNRCGALGGNYRTEHTWEGWQYSSFYKARVNVCKHCGLMPLNFDGTTTYAITMQDVDKLYAQLLRSKSVFDIVSAIRVNKSYFAKSPNPTVKAYRNFVATQMPNGNMKEARKNIEAVMDLIGITGVDVVLPYLEDVQYQAGSNPWGVVISKIKEVNSYVQRLANLDKGLVGHWRYTESLGDSSFSMITDFHKIFAGDGSYAEYKHSVSAALGSDTRSAVTNGTWWSENGTVYVELENGAQRRHFYQINSNYLILVISGENQYWEKVR